MYRRALALVAVVAAAAAGDAPAGPYDNPICGTADWPCSEGLELSISSPSQLHVMASYNTVPDLESEAQPLAGAPPRKHGKATLAVVAALAFGAGALAPSAAARVSQMKLFDMTPASVNNAAPASTACPDGADEVATNPDCYTNGLTGGGRDAGETIIVDGRK